MRRSELEDKPDTERVITSEITVPAPLTEVWHAWTTKEGAERFFAPRCNIDLKPGGAYEMLFDLDAAPGKQGGEGMVVMAVSHRGCWRLHGMPRLICQACEAR